MQYTSIYPVVAFHKAYKTNKFTAVCLALSGTMQFAISALMQCIELFMAIEQIYFEPTPMTAFPRNKYFGKSMLPRTLSTLYAGKYIFWGLSFLLITQAIKPAPNSYNRIWWTATSHARNEIPRWHVTELQQKHFSHDAHFFVAFFLWSMVDDDDYCNILVVWLMSYVWRTSVLIEFPSESGQIG